ncbi:serine/threonine/tyrosine-protein kinase HT1 [Physcomitrium patens]|uniref:Protein kinase domain-containing protein n=1 Tax=Physcomitrium patens TaxID=3218 RepID=A0A2K1ISH5_PHYPA|nr:serine/threonine-protein kinase HT1-like [Physcomitrium patens]PNR32222.1 hypothetical protein PHYPA_026348 [Physcomitrium patens]|eukprot:XP_024358978.1 serine/threonine-protein kinase HT1-like [Physcomitrella patens]
MAKHREKVTTAEPVQYGTGLGKLHVGGHGFHPKLAFFGFRHNTKTIPLGIHFTVKVEDDHVAELGRVRKSRSLERSPKLGDSPGRTRTDEPSAERGSHHWLRKKKSTEESLARAKSIDPQPTSRHRKNVKFSDTKKPESWAHFVEASQEETPHLELEVTEDHLCDLSSLFLGEKFASGNHTRLYRGVYKDQVVAVKILMIDRYENSATATKLERQFIQEVHNLSQLHHPNIVTFVAASWKPPVCCLIMEYVPGGSLRAFLHKKESGSLPYKTMLSMALDIAKGMEFLHSQGVVHRDLKSENIVLTDDLHLKLTDFGVGCLETECDSNSADTGTYRWMAPEMISHQHCSKKVDVYSFGIILWELVTGLIPFQDMTPVQVAYAVVNKNLRPHIPAECPSALQHLMDCCWVANPAHRPNFFQIAQTLQDLAR